MSHKQTLDRIFDIACQLKVSQVWLVANPQKHLWQALAQKDGAWLEEPLMEESWMGLVILLTHLSGRCGLEGPLQPTIQNGQLKLPNLTVNVSIYPGEHVHEAKLEFHHYDPDESTPSGLFS